MNKYLNHILLSASLSVFMHSPLAESTSLQVALQQAIQGDHRLPANVERDIFRRPAETLTFFGLQPQMTVVEIWPGRGWYTEILAPTLRDQGKLYVAGFATSAERTPKWRKKMQQDFTDKLAAHPDVYDQAIVSELSIPEQTAIAPEGTADMVLTFRNVHNWMKGDYAAQMFEVFARTLKPGGILGVVEHRAEPDTSVADMIASGYVTEQHVIDLAEAAGFVLEARSDINANGLDSKSHPKGVWTLPPTLRYCKAMEAGAEKDRCMDEYLVIGESDRMTLKFRKAE